MSDRVHAGQGTAHGAHRRRQRARANAHLTSMKNELGDCTRRFSCAREESKWTARHGGGERRARAPAECAADGGCAERCAARRGACAAECATAAPYLVQLGLVLGRRVQQVVIDLHTSQQRERKAPARSDPDRSSRRTKAAAAAQAAAATRHRARRNTARQHHAPYSRRRERRASGRAARQRAGRAHSRPACGMAAGCPARASPRRRAAACAAQCADRHGCSVCGVRQRLQQTVNALSESPAGARPRLRFSLDAHRVATDAARKLLHRFRMRTLKTNNIPSK